MPIPNEVQVEWLGNRVGGIARPADSPAVFIRNALPGETVRIRPVNVKKSFVEAELVSIEEASPFRTEPFCPYYGTCGGCSLQHIRYDRELYWKREWVEKALRNLDHPEVSQVLSSGERKASRNRITFDVLNGRLHLHAFRGDPIPVETCPLMNSRAAEAFKTVMNALLPDTLARVSVRGAVNTSCRALEFTGPSPEIRGEEGLSVYSLKGRNWKSISGTGMTEKICGYTFPVPPGGFFQVNTTGAEQLLDTVLRMVPGNAGDLLDLYGGVGTFGVPLAAAGFTVHSVEMNMEASAGCSMAASMNGIPEGRLHVSLSRDRNYLSDALRRGQRFDVVVTDPPRAGMGIRITRQIRRLSPAVLVYVSCNPFSAVRDIAIFLQGGYRIAGIQPVDMFPGTDHVETVFLLERGNR